jgi:RecA-family ATPase
MTAEQVRDRVDAAPKFRTNGYGGPDSQHHVDLNPETAVARASSDAPENRAWVTSKVDINRLLDTPPPPRQWIVRDRLPLNIVGLLAAAGSTGKSMAVLQLAVAVCSGTNWLGMPIERSGGVLIVSAEDDRDEIHRRLHPILHHYEWQLGGAAVRELVRTRLNVFDRVGLDNRLTKKTGDGLSTTPIADLVAAIASELTDVVLIVLDPLSRFDGGEPNDNSDATRLIEAAEHIRTLTGATVLLPHHVAKTSVKDKDAGQEAVRGASGLVDGARWVGLLQTMQKENAPSYGISKNVAGFYVRFTTPKANYSAPWDGMWLRRVADGLLEPIELEESVKSAARSKGDEVYKQVLPKLVALITKHEVNGQPLTRRTLRNFSGTSGTLGVSEGALRGIINRAVEDGSVVEIGLKGTNGVCLGAPR